MRILTACVCLLSVPAIAYLYAQPAGAQGKTQPRHLSENELARIRFGDLRRISTALHGYYDKHGSFPPAAVDGRNGATHSWRVALLPQLGHQDLYNEYRLDEPWDSPANIKLLQRIPDVYQAHGAPKESTNACYFAIVGDGTAFAARGKGLELKDFFDGTSNTLLVVESKRAVPWTKPQDIDYSIDKPLPKLGGFHEGGFACVFADRSLRFIMEVVKEPVVRNIIGRKDAVPLDLEELGPASL